MSPNVTNNLATFCKFFFRERTQKVYLKWWFKVLRKKVLPFPCEKLMIFLGFVFVTSKQWKCCRERDATLTWGRQHKNRKSGPDYSARSRACFHVELSLLNQSTESIAELQSNYNPIDFDTAIARHLNWAPRVYFTGLLVRNHYLTLVDSSRLCFDLKCVTLYW